MIAKDDLMIAAGTKEILVRRFWILPPAIAAFVYALPGAIDPFSYTSLCF
jgi:hypothetical protein